MMDKSILDLEHISLFGGIGGFDLAFERAGIPIGTICEIDPACQTILRRHFPHARIIDDVKKVGVATHEKGTVGIVCGGFPCQDLSIAGERKGLAGERSGLWFEFARVVDELEPRVVLGENVPGLLSSQEGQDFSTILQWLVGRGYGVAWRVLDAQYFGVAQCRRRVFFFASFGDGRAAEILFEGEGLLGNNPKGRKGRKENTSQVVVGSDGRSGAGDKEDKWMIAYNIQNNDGGQHKRKDRPNGGMYINETDLTVIVSSGQDVASPLGSGKNGQRGDLDGKTYVMASGQANAEVRKDVSPALTKLHEQPIVFTPMVLEQNTQASTPDMPSLRAGETPNFVVAIDEGENEKYPSATTFTIRQGNYGGGKGYLGLEEKAMTLGGQEQLLWEMSHPDDVVREGKDSDISPTLQARMGTGGNQVPMIGVRRLTPTECARLQGFPDDWCDGQSDSTKYKEFGNAVAVPVVKWIADRIKKVYGLEEK